MTSKLKLAILLTSDRVHQWESQCLARIAEIFHVKPIVVLNACTHSKAKTPILLYALQFYESFKHKKSYDAFKKVTIPLPFKLLPSIDVHSMNEKVAKQLGQQRIDIIVKIGVTDFDESILLNYSTHGIWSIEFDHQTHWGWESLLNRKPITNSYLVVKTATSSDGVIIYDSTSSTDDWSGLITMNRVAWKSAYFIPRMITQLQDILLSPQSHSWKSYPKWSGYSSVPWYHHQLNRKILWHLVKLLKLKRDKLVHNEKWDLFCSSQANALNDFNSFKRIKTPHELFRADPFVIDEKQTSYIFFEEGHIKHKKGHISCLGFDQYGRCQYYSKILEKEYHLSYPFIFKWGKDYFMIPESSQNRSVDLYKCNKFPSQWMFQHSIMRNVMAYDATLFPFKDRWWMFVNMKIHPGMSSWDELYIFFADNPVSQEWTAHRNNPVISDVRRARPAGKIFFHNHKLIRPSQNSSFRYGYGLKFNEIVKLNDKEFEERELKSIYPNQMKGIRCVHTYNSTNQITFIDGRVLN